MRWEQIEQECSEKYTGVHKERFLEQIGVDPGYYSNVYNNFPLQKYALTYDQLEMYGFSEICKKIKQLGIDDAELEKVTVEIYFPVNNLQNVLPKFDWEGSPIFTRIFFDEKVKFERLRIYSKEDSRFYSRSTTYLSPRVFVQQGNLVQQPNRGIFVWDEVIGNYRTVKYP